MHRIFNGIIIGALLVAMASPAFAVTEKEMEQAKAIAAQAYLRYANDGSGYLDDFKATSLSELEGKLKAKEKENIKAFKSVKIPGDYASWDKTKLIEFWSVTFFTSPNLSEKGKVAKSRVKSRISAMSISESSVSSPASDNTEKETSPKRDETPEIAIEPATTEITSELPTAEEAMEQQEEILADQNAIANDNAEKTYKKDNGNTLWYVIALVLLIGCVIWLVLFAVKVMKKQSEAIPDNAGAEGYAHNDSNPEILSALKASETENRSLSETLERLKAENAKLRKELMTLKATQQSAKAIEESPVTKHMPNEIYLGRVNSNGLFVRADRRYVGGSTIYRLDTRDGMVGTFFVVDRPETLEIALSNPQQYLLGGCTGDELDNTAGVENIVTVNAGTAIFEDGCWKVLRKSRIRYE